MLKKDLIDLINKFETETWKYENSDGLEEDMEYIYSMENEIKNADESSLKTLYEKLTALIGVIRFKYGFEGIIIKSNPELKNLNEIINSFSLSDGNVIEQYNYISAVFNNNTNKNKDLSFIVNNYRQLLDENQINDILIDCIMLNNGKRDIKTLELKYRDLINKIWANALSNKVENNGNFTKVGKIFGVNDNSIRKVCKKYNLPYHSKDYQQPKQIIPPKNSNIPIRVAQCEKESGKIIRIFESIKDAEKITKIQHIYAASDPNNFSRQTAGGYIWKRL